MIKSSRVPFSQAMVRTFVIVAIAIIILSANFTIIHAQPLSQPPPPIQNPSTSATTTMTATTTAPSTRTFLQSNNDSFSIRVPQGWTISDVNNTGLVLSDEAVRGYGLLAQLCPAEEQQQLTFSTNASGSNTPNCRASENDVIHVIRYPNLETRLLANNGTAASNSNNTTTTGNITAYHLQKLEEVGYHDINILKSANMRVNLSIAAGANQTVAVATLPANFAEITYTTAVAPNVTKTGYFILTATNATAPNFGTTKGYSIFYEGNSNTSNSVSSAPTLTRTTATAPSSLRPATLSPAVAQMLGSFQLIVAPELAQALAQQSAVGQTGQSSTVGQTQEGGSSCDPSYPDVCIPPPPPNLNCDDPGIPDDFVVVGSDPHRFDGDNDGIGCDTPGGAGGSDVSNDVGDDGDDGGGDSSCHPSYPDVCIPPPPPDLNCDDPGIPDNFDVVGSDPHGFDCDNDGIGCETSGGAGGSNDDGADDDDDDGGGVDDGGGDGGGDDDDGGGVDDGGGDGGDDDDGGGVDDGGGDGGGDDDDGGGVDDGGGDGGGDDDDGGGVDDGGGDGGGDDDDGGGVDDGGGDGGGDDDDGGGVDDGGGDGGGDDDDGGGVDDGGGDGGGDAD